MTDAQIRYSQLLETRRHNIASEELTKYATDTQAATSRYATDVSAGTSRYVAQVSASTQRYVADTNARTQLTTAALAAETSRYATDTQASVSNYRTDKESQDRRLRLRFDRQTQVIKNNLEKQKVELETYRTLSQDRVNTAQVIKTMQDVENSIQQLELNAKALGLQEEAAKYTNALNQARMLEASASAADKTVSAIQRGIDSVLKIIAAVK